MQRWYPPRWRLAQLQYRMHLPFSIRLSCIVDSHAFPIAALFPLLLSPGIPTTSSLRRLCTPHCTSPAKELEPQLQRPRLQHPHTVQRYQKSIQTRYQWRSVEAQRHLYVRYSGIKSPSAFCIATPSTANARPATRQFPHNLLPIDSY